MIDDAIQRLDAARRVIGSRELDTGEARVTTVTQAYASTVDDLWDSCTNPERIPRWFLPVTGDLRVGGRYQLVGNAGGTVERCAQPRSFAATWEYGGDVSWIEVELTELPEGGTQLTLNHIAHVADEFWEQYGPGATGIGWELALLGLSAHLSSGEAVDPAAAMAWTTSEAGRRFITLSSQRWCDASILFGTPSAEARAAADRVTEFYAPTVPAES